MNKNKIKFATFIIVVFISNIVLAEAYFDISEANIKIETNFIGKEVIIFGILNDDQDTIITIKGPEKNAVIQKKERILGFWFNTKKIIYNKIPSIFFILIFALIGMLIERYLFFIQAKHVVSLYYGENKV
jgi:hypothetical protein